MGQPQGPYGPQQGGWQQPQQGPPQGQQGGWGQQQQPQQGFDPYTQQGQGQGGWQPFAGGQQMGGGGYDWNTLYGQADHSVGQLIDAGPYTAIVKSSAWDRTKDGTKSAWTIVFILTNGPRPGMRITMTLSVSPKKNNGEINEAGMGIMFRQLAAMGIPCPPPYGQQGWWQLGWSETQAGQAMTGRPVLLQLVQDEYNGMTRNKVGDILPPPPGAPTQLPQTGQQQQGGPMPAPGAPFPAQGQAPTWSNMQQQGPPQGGPPPGWQQPQQAQPQPGQQPQQGWEQQPQQGWGQQQQQPQQGQAPQPWQQPQQQGPSQSYGQQGPPQQGPPQGQQGQGYDPSLPPYAQPAQPGQPGTGQFTPGGQGVQPGTVPEHTQQQPWANPNGAPGQQQGGYAPQQGQPPQHGQQPPGEPPQAPGWAAGQQ